MKEIAILGSTGSIGRQALDVVARLDTVSVAALCANKNGALLAGQARDTGARIAALADREQARAFKRTFDEMGVELLTGAEGVLELIGARPYGLVLNAMVGSAGLAPTLAVLEKGVPLALANKESLVAGGNLVMGAARRNGVEVIPVDSEHSAVFQCLRGENAAAVRRIILTASGGPFLESPADLSKVTAAEALAHPTWSMGPKVTVDSSTLMNKGLEVLEAHHLFSTELDAIDVVIHPQSIVHSMVEMVDGSVLAHLGVPDMRIPIQYALTHPDRSGCPAGYLSLVEAGSLTFAGADSARFPCLRLAREAGRLGRTYPAAMNAANEEAVGAFLEGRIRYTGIAMVVQGVMESHHALAGASLGDILDAEAEAREAANRLIDGMES